MVSKNVFLINVKALSSKIDFCENIRIFIKKAFENASLKLCADGTVTDKNAQTEEKSEERLEEERRAKSLLTTLNSQVFYK